LERQFHYTHVVDHLADTGLTSFYQRGIRLYFNRLRNLTDFQVNPTSAFVEA